MTAYPRRRRALAALLLLVPAAGLLAQTPSFVATPLTEMRLSQSYLGFSGGLYPNGGNVPPPAHAAAGQARALAIQPLDTSGNPDPAGKIALLSIGMSNTTQEFCSAGGLQPCDSWTFVGQALADSDVNHSTLAFVNGARGGQDAQTWDAPADPNYDRVRDTDLAAQGLTEAQVQAIWLKEADIGPSSSLPASSADAYTLETFLGDIIRAARARYPNLQCVFLSSRIYAGYASTMLNPEPYGYESGFAVKWVVQAQIDQMANGGVIVDPRAGDLTYDTGAPWIGWGPYLWADGLIPRGSDGLVWDPVDYQSDGTHPSQSGETKVGTMLLTFFESDPRTRPWFLALGDVAVTPTSGPAAGAGITVTGSGFQGGATLSVGGLSALGVSVTPTAISATTPTLAAGTLNDVLVANPDATTGSIVKGFFADFSDVDGSHLFHDFVESIFRAGITVGCGGGGGYCPDASVTRAEMAVLLLKSRFGPNHVPPAATGAVFGDVQPGDFAADWIEELAALQVTGGCGNGNYCPADPVTRAQMAVFLLKTEHGVGYQPNPCSGIFADVPCPSTPNFPYSDWIEQLYAEGVTGGCATAPLRYCPDAANLRGEMAVFLVKTFALP